MNLPKELIEKIENYFQYDKEFKEQLLSGNVHAIQKLGGMLKEIDSEDIVEAYENDCIEYIYRKAQRTVALKTLYKKLVNWYVYSALKSRL